MGRRETISDYDIQAFVDNELDHDMADLVRAYINTNNYAQQRYRELCHQKELLMMLYDHNDNNQG